MEISHFAETANMCVNESAKLVGQCNDYAGFVLIVGLAVGAIMGAAGLYVGMRYYGRKQ